MDKYKKLVNAFRSIVPAAGLPLLPAQVKAITGDSCTVEYGDMELTDVKLKATIGGTNKILLLPKIGSTVLIGSLTGDFKDLVVLKIDELQKIVYEQDGLQLTVDTTTGKVAVANEEVSLKGLFQQLTDLLKTFKVFTPVGPSGTALPDTQTKIVQFETDFKKLLQ